mgnify:CR=1 FL=1
MNFSLECTKYITNKMSVENISKMSVFSVLIIQFSNCSAYIKMTVSKRNLPVAICITDQKYNGNQAIEVRVVVPYCFVQEEYVPVGHGK